MEIVMSKNQRKKLRKKQNKAPAGRNSNERKTGKPQSNAAKTNEETTQPEKFNMVENAHDIDSGKVELVFYKFVEGANQETIKKYLQIRGVKWEHIKFFQEKVKNRKAALVRLKNDREAVIQCYLCFERRYKHMGKEIHSIMHFGESESRDVERMYRMFQD